MMLHPVGGRRQPDAGIQHILELDHPTYTPIHLYTYTCPLGNGRGGWESPHAPGIHQLATGGIHHQVVVSEEINPQDGELNLRQ
jgi:hypothetical protein